VEREGRASYEKDGGVRRGRAFRAQTTGLFSELYPAGFSACDFYPFNDYPLVRDLGILASEDPVAIDQASVDLVNQEPGLWGSKVKEAGPGEDKFRKLYPQLPWEITLEHAEKIGLGTRKYELVKPEA